MFKNMYQAQQHLAVILIPHSNFERYELSPLIGRPYQGTRELASGVSKYASSFLVTEFLRGKKIL